MTKILFAFVSLFSFAFAAQYSADLQLTTLTSELCPYTTVQVLGHLANNGESPDSYAITSDSPWIKIAPDTITLNKGETANVYIYITPTLAAAGQYPLKININSKNGAKDIETISLNLLRCHGVTLASKTTTQSSCIGEKASFPVDITNAGKYSETFDIITNNNAAEE